MKNEDDKLTKGEEWGGIAVGVAAVFAALFILGGGLSKSEKAVAVAEPVKVQTTKRRPVYGVDYVWREKHRTSCARWGREVEACIWGDKEGISDMYSISLSDAASHCEKSWKCHRQCVSYNVSNECTWMRDIRYLNQ